MPDKGPQKRSPREGCSDWGREVVVEPDGRAAEQRLGEVLVTEIPEH